MLGFVAETREAVAAVLRPGNAGANTAIDKIAVVAEALRQRPPPRPRTTAPDATEEQRIVVRCDTAGATHDLVEACREMGLRYSIGFPIVEPLRDTVLGLESWRWLPAIEADGTLRDGA